jgi:rhodanese-related sulfurtransferase
MITVSGAASADLGNRYGLPQIYQSEISAAEAYIVTNNDKGHKNGNDYAGAVIIDVRSIPEHVAGHPPKSYNIPFPHVLNRPDDPNDTSQTIVDDSVDPPITIEVPYIGYDLSGNADICFVDGCDNDTNNDGTLDPDDFVSYVKSVFPDMDTPILTLCATGYRSVQAANLLTRAGYTNVRNIWEGYNGQPKYAYSGGSVKVPLEKLDLNHDGGTDGKDRDGWAYFQGLPTSTQIHPQRIFSTYSDLYYQ